MWRYLVGGIAALLMVTAGFFFFRSGAKPDQPLFAPPPAQTAGSPAPLPSSAPAASEKTREEKRFDRYDKDRDGWITRDEYLASRRKAYARLDTNHDGVLSFDEWSVKSLTTFLKADADRSGAMNAGEFLTTKVERKSTPKCSCAATHGD